MAVPHKRSQDQGEAEGSGGAGVCALAAAGGEVVGLDQLADWRTTSGRRSGWVYACLMEPSRPAESRSGRPVSLAGAAGAARSRGDGEITEQYAYQHPLGNLVPLIRDSDGTKTSKSLGDHSLPSHSTSFNSLMIRDGPFPGSVRWTLSFDYASVSESFTCGK